MRRQASNLKTESLSMLIRSRQCSIQAPAAALVFVLAWQGAPELFTGLTDWWAPWLLLATSIAAVGALIALWQRQFRLARIACHYAGVIDSQRLGTCPISRLGCTNPDNSGDGCTSYYLTIGHDRPCVWDSHSFALTCLSFLHF